eukprot:422971-Pyramimonas_sp.AAC.6
MQGAGAPAKSSRRFSRVFSDVATAVAVGADAVRIFYQTAKARVRRCGMFTAECHVCRVPLLAAKTDARQVRVKPAASTDTSAPMPPVISCTRAATASAGSSPGSRSDGC